MGWAFFCQSIIERMPFSQIFCQLSLSLSLCLSVSLCVCLCVYLHICIFLCVSGWVCIPTCQYMCVPLCVYLHILYLCVSVSVYLHICIFVCVCVCVYVNLYISISVCTATRLSCRHKSWNILTVSGLQGRTRTRCICTMLSEGSTENVIMAHPNSFGQLLRTTQYLAPCCKQIYFQPLWNYWTLT